MKNTWILISVIILSVLNFNSAFAQTQSRQLIDFRIAAWHTGTLIDTMNLIEDDNPAGCAQGGRYWAFNPDFQNTEYQLTLLAEARVTNTPIWVGINGCYNDKPRVVFINR